MEKDSIVIATTEANKIIKKKKIKIAIDVVYNKNNINTLINKKRKEAIIYDITYIDSKKETIKVRDHINKTGENPLIGKQQKLQIDFIDITNIYTDKKEGVVTTSLGSTKGKKEFKKTKNPSTEMSNIAVLCQALEFKKIEGILINCFDLF